MTSRQFLDVTEVWVCQQTGADCVCLLRVSISRRSPDSRVMARLSSLPDTRGPSASLFITVIQLCLAGSLTTASQWLVWPGHAESQRIAGTRISKYQTRADFDLLYDAVDTCYNE